jgi:hypothetical protein
MNTTRAAKALSFFALASWIAASAGCSSSDDAGGGASGPFEPPGNGQPMGEAEACNALKDAESARRAALSCGPVTSPSCPGYISAGNEKCSVYDQGTVQGCIDYVSKLTSCDALKPKNCVVKALPGSAPNGCPPPVDAGVDSGTDSGTDAGADSGVDSGMDAAADAAADATPDATADSAAEAGDAATD